MLLIDDVSETTHVPQLFEFDNESKTKYRDNLLHYSAQISNTVAKCYKDPDSPPEPLFCKQISDFSKLFKMSTAFIAKTEYCEFKEVTAEKTREVHLCKIYRKNEFSEVSIECIRREIKLLTDLDHPNILKCVQVFEDESKVYLICENLKGGTLLYNHILVEGCFDEVTTA
jgi:calcium-dependent protein kinase